MLNDSPHLQSFLPPFDLPPRAIDRQGMASTSNDEESYLDEKKVKKLNERTKLNTNGRGDISM